MKGKALMWEKIAASMTGHDGRIGTSGERERSRV